MILAHGTFLVAIVVQPQVARVCVAGLLFKGFDNTRAGLLAQAETQVVEECEHVLDRKLTEEQTFDRGALALGERCSPG